MKDYEVVYEVVWRIQLIARSAKHAAKIARKIQMDPGSEATVFEVTSPSCCQPKIIDLYNEEVTSNEGE